MASITRSTTLLHRVVVQRCVQHTQKATLIPAHARIIDKDFLTWLQNPKLTSDPKSWVKAYQDHQEAKRKQLQMFDKNLRENVGIEIAAAHFIVQQGGAVKFLNSNRWVKRGPLGGSPLPYKSVSGYCVEAIDASGLNLIYDSFDMLDDLRYLKYLNVSGCKYLDDWFFERLVMLRDSLIVLNVSRCPEITENGLASLHKLGLTRLICEDMPAVKRPALVKLLLEEMMPNTVIQGLEDYTAKDALEKTEPIPEPVLIVPPVHLAEEITKGVWRSVYLHEDDDAQEEEEERRKRQKLLAPPPEAREQSTTQETVAENSALESAQKQTVAR